MASGHMNRVKRPDTWLHRPMLQNVKKVLANPEPSTHDPTRTLQPLQQSCSGGLASPKFTTARSPPENPCGAHARGSRKIAMSDEQQVD